MNNILHNISESISNASRTLANATSAAAIKSSAMSSNLSSLGYDLVVATTQKSVNATMLQYLSETDKIQPTIQFYGWEQTVDPETKRRKAVLTPWTSAQLAQKAPGVDPFKISKDADPYQDPGLVTLSNIEFALGISILPGLPMGIAPEKMPNIIDFGNDTSKVTYNMLCAEVHICSMTYTGREDVQWSVFSQPSDQAWAFSCFVDLRMENDDSGSAWNKLDPKVRAAIKQDFSGEDAFSVQQLLFDLDNAGLETVPSMVIAGGQQVLDPDVTAKINGTFLSAYFADMHQKGQPMLHVAVISKKPDVSELRATAMRLEVCQQLDPATGKPMAHPSNDQLNLSTLNYLCMSNGHPLPSLHRPNWNWINMDESHNYDGVIAYGRAGFANMMKEQLLPLVLANCYIAKSYVWKSSSLPHYACGFKRLNGDPIINPTNNGDVANGLNGQSGSPNFRMTNAPDPMLMEWTWDQENGDETKLTNPGVTLGSMDLKPHFHLSVHVEGNTISVEQNLSIWLSIMKQQDSHSGYVVNRTIKETFQLKVDNGKLVMGTPSIDTQDNPDNISSNAFMNFFNDINSTINDIRNAAQATTTKFSPAPLTAVQRFQFPGGKTFAFRDFRFSDNQDLTAGITYVDPV